MFKSHFQSGFLSVLYSIGSKPLQIWDATVSLVQRRGFWGSQVLTSRSFCHRSAWLPLILCVGSQRAYQAHHRQRHPVPGYWDCGNQREVWGRPHLPLHNLLQHHVHLVPCRPKGNFGNQASVSGHDHQELEKVLHIWSSSKSNTKETFLTDKVLDDKNVRRRFRASNYQSNTRVKPFICTMPMRLDDGWNQIQVYIYATLVLIYIRVFDCCAPVRPWNWRIASPAQHLTFVV